MSKKSKKWGGAALDKNGRILLEEIEYDNDVRVEDDGAWGRGFVASDDKSESSSEEEPAKNYKGEVEDEEEAGQANKDSQTKNQGKKKSRIKGLFKSPSKRSQKDEPSPNSNKDNSYRSSPEPAPAPQPIQSQSQSQQSPKPPARQATLQESPSSPQPPAQYTRRMSEISDISQKMNALDLFLLNHAQTAREGQKPDEAEFSGFTFDVMKEAFPPPAGTTTTTTNTLSHTYGHTRNKSKAMMPPEEEPPLPPVIENELEGQEPAQSSPPSCAPLQRELSDPFYDAPGLAQPPPASFPTSPNPQPSTTSLLYPSGGAPSQSLYSQPAKASTPDIASPIPMSKIEPQKSIWGMSTLSNPKPLPTPVSKASSNPLPNPSPSSNTSSNTSPVSPKVQLTPIASATVNNPEPNSRPISPLTATSLNRTITNLSPSPIRMPLISNTSSPETPPMQRVPIVSLQTSSQSNPRMTETWNDWTKTTGQKPQISQSQEGGSVSPRSPRSDGLPIAQRPVEVRATLPLDLELLRPIPPPPTLPPRPSLEKASYLHVDFEAFREHIRYQLQICVATSKVLRENSLVLAKEHKDELFLRIIAAAKEIKVITDALLDKEVEGVASIDSLFLVCQRFEKRAVAYVSAHRSPASTPLNGWRSALTFESRDDMARAFKSMVEIISELVATLKKY